MSTVHTLLAFVYMVNISGSFYTTLSQPTFLWLPLIFFHSLFPSLPQLNTPFVFWLILVTHTHTLYALWEHPSHFISVFTTTQSAACLNHTILSPLNTQMETLHVPCSGLMEALTLVMLLPCSAHWVLLDHIIMRKKREKLHSLASPE